MIVLSVDLQCSRHKYGMRHFRKATGKAPSSLAKKIHIQSGKIKFFSLTARVLSQWSETPNSSAIYLKDALLCQAYKLYSIFCSKLTTPTIVTARTVGREHPSWSTSRLQMTSYCGGSLAGWGCTARLTLRLSALNMNNGNVAYMRKSR